jgi:hypothetical protein
VNRDDIRQFAQRDWSRIAAAKDAFWRGRKRGRPAAEILAAGEALRRHARAVRPDWPTVSDRAADLAAHHRVAEALRAVHRRPR